ncbi:MAG: FtsQ-type POTRA domain-containing protein [Anaerolineae bacterium]|nr:FtsQ-type POTRA domain-containing protein [Anaerolineae bacterium]
MERVRPIGVIWISWRWVSGIMSGILTLIVAVLLYSDAFYVSTVSVGGVNYLTREEVFRFAGISQKHIFWVDPAQVEAELERNNNIAAAEVRVRWSSPLVQIVVQERDPVLIWEQGNDRVWVDINGVVMFQREDRADLLRVVYDPNEVPTDSGLGPGSRIDREIVQGALLLRSRLSGAEVLLYHPQQGLGWRDPRGWTVWFGTGENMAMKALVYEGLVAAQFSQVQFGEVDVSDPDYPVFTVLWRKSE